MSSANWPDRRNLSFRSEKNLWYIISRTSLRRRRRGLRRVCWNSDAQEMRTVSSATEADRTSLSAIWFRRATQLAADLGETESNEWVMLCALLATLVRDFERVFSVSLWSKYDGDNSSRRIEETCQVLAPSSAVTQWSNFVMLLGYRVQSQKILQPSECQIGCRLRITVPLLSSSAKRIHNMLRTQLLT